ncbi:hypothetical protein FH128_01745 [Staphylococcus hominis]|nr:hypothetical protein [Staphylococcus hominis]MCI2898656.1 hypothetical protein [Staphylococcus hominis]
MMWLIILCVFLTILTFGFAIENAKLRGNMEGKEYQIMILERRLSKYED